MKLKDNQPKNSTKVSTM